MWHRPAVRIQPLLELRLGPMFIKPVTRIRNGFAKLFRDGFVVLTGCTEERVALSWLRRRDTMFIQESLQLGLSPTERKLVKSRG